MNLKKFLLLYMGPFGLNPSQAPITQAGLDGWAQRIGNALVDRGTLLSPFGRSVFDDGTTAPPSYPVVHGYSIIQAQDIASTTALLRDHPFLSNGRDGDYEIEVLELTDADIPPDAVDNAPLETIMGIPYSDLDAMMAAKGAPAPDDVTTAQQPQPQQTQQVIVNPSPLPPSNPDNGELSVPHDTPMPGQTISPPNPPSNQQPPA